MGLEFTLDQKLLLPVFKEYRNTIDIYTEDEDKDKEFYLLLFNRMLKETGIEINDIYPLGCKRTVISSCESDTDYSRRKIFIVDGDVELQYKKKSIKRLYELDAYCIENLIIDEDSICNTVNLFLGAPKPLSQIKISLDYNHTLKTICKDLTNLFFHYSIHFEHFDCFKLLHMDSFMTPDKKNINTDLIQQKIEEIKNKLICNGVSEEEYHDKLKIRNRSFNVNEISSLLTVVSGKDFLIPFMSHHLKNCFGSKVLLPKEAWKYNMARFCNLDRLNGLKTAIIKT